METIQYMTPIFTPRNNFIMLYTSTKFGSGLRGLSFLRVVLVWNYPIDREQAMINAALKPNYCSVTVPFRAFRILVGGTVPFRSVPFRSVPDLSTCNHHWSVHACAFWRWLAGRPWASQSRYLVPGPHLSVTIATASYSTEINRRSRS